MSDWISVEDRPLITYTTSALGRRWHIENSDMNLFAILTEGGWFICHAYISDNMQLEDIYGDPVGYSGEDVAYWMQLSEPSQ